MNSLLLTEKQALFSVSVHHQAEFLWWWIRTGWMKNQRKKKKKEEVGMSNARRAWKGV